MGMVPALIFGQRGEDPRTHAQADRPSGWTMQRAAKGGKSITRAQKLPDPLFLWRLRLGEG